MDGKGRNDGFAVTVQQDGEATGIAGDVVEVVHTGLGIHPDLTAGESSVRMDTLETLFALCHGDDAPFLFCNVDFCRLYEELDTLNALDTNHRSGFDPLVAFAAGGPGQSGELHGTKTTEIVDGFGDDGQFADIGRGIGLHFPGLVEFLQLPMLSAIIRL